VNASKKRDWAMEAPYIIDRGYLDGQLRIMRAAVIIVASRSTANVDYSPDRQKYTQSYRKNGDV
jgi:hypothetical protein